MGGELGVGAVVRDRYRVVSVLGRGAGGVTYEVAAVDGAARYALKRLSVTGAAEWKPVELFEREARVLAQLEHDAIPRYVEYFVEEGPDGVTLSLVQELAPARSLAAWLASGWRPTEDEITSVALQVLRVLDHIHELHPPLVHRDVKPDNVLRAADGKVYLVDFGGVRDVIRTAAHGSTVVGTYGYMPPEQFRGAAVPASDVYGLGATLVHLLTGVSPASLPQRKLRVDFRSRTRVSPALGAWLDRALEPAPEDRFQSAREAELALRSRAVARPGSPVGRIAALAGALVVVAVGSLALGLRYLRVPRVPASPPAATVAEVAPKAGGALRPLPQRPPPSTALVGRCTSFANGSGRTNDLRVAADGSKIVTAGDGGVTVRSPSGETLRALPPPGGRTWSAVFDRSAEHVIAGGVDGRLRAYRLSDGSTEWTLDVGAPIRRLEWSNDGARLLVAAEDGTAKIVDPAARRVALTLRHGPGDVMAAVPHPDGATVYTAGDDRTIKAWDLATGALRGTLSGHQGPVTSLAFFDGGRRLVSGSDDTGVIAWDVAGGRMLRTSTWHSAPVWTVTTSPDGRYVLSGGQDRSVAISDAATGTMVAQLAGAQMVSGVFDGAGNVVLGQGQGGVNVCRLARRGRGTPLPVPGPAAKGAPAPRTPDEVAVAEVAAEADRFPDPFDFDAAEAKLRKALARSPRMPMAHVVLARVAIDRAVGAGSGAAAFWRAAERELDEAARLDPKLAAVQVVRARLGLNQGDYDAAERGARAALALDPRDARARLVALEIASRGREPELGKKLAALVTDTTDPYVLGRAYDALGRVALDDGDVDLADGAYTKAQELFPARSIARGEYAEFLRAIGETERAVALATPVGGSVLARAEIERGNALLWDLGQADAARAAFERALAADPSEAYAHYGLAAYHRARAVQLREPASAERSLAEIRLTQRLAREDERVARLVAEHPAVAAASRARR